MSANTHTSLAFNLENPVVNKLEFGVKQIAGALACPVEVLNLAFKSRIVEEFWLTERWVPATVR